MRVDIILLVNPWRLGDVLLTECWLQQKQTKSLHTLTRAMSNSADSARAKKNLCNSQNQKLASGKDKKNNNKIVSHWCNSEDKKQKEIELFVHSSTNAKD